MIACKCYHEGQKAAADPNERKDVPPLFCKRINLSGINRGYILYLSHHQGMSYNDWQ